MSEKAKEQLRRQIIEAALKRLSEREVIAERLYKEAPGWKFYAYVPFKDAPQIVREEYLRKADKQEGGL